MPAVNLSEDGYQTLEKIKESFDVTPSNRQVAERALELYYEERQS